MRKINLKLAVRPKFLWVSTIVFLFGTSAVFFLLKENEKDLKLFFQNEFLSTSKEKSIVEKKFIVAIMAKKRTEEQLVRTEEQLVTEKERTVALGRELEERDQQIRVTLNKLENEIGGRRQAEAKLIIVMREKKNLEGKIREVKGESEAIDLERIVVASGPRLGGKVLEANKEYGFVVVDLGRDNDVRLGDVFSIYRENALIGSAEVEKVEEEFCAAAILPGWEQGEFRENDKVVVSKQYRW